MKINEFKSKEGKTIDVSIIDDSSKEIIYSCAKKILKILNIKKILITTNKGI